MIGKYVKTDVIKAYPTTPIREATGLMSQRRVGLVVLVDPKDPYKIVGVVSECDIVKAVACGVSLDAAVDTIAARNVIALDCSEPVAKAAEVFDAGLGTS